MVKSAKLIKMAISRQGITRMERSSPEKFSAKRSPLAKSQQSMKTMRKSNENEEIKLLFSRLREIVPTCTGSTSSNTTVVVEAAKYICKLQDLLQLQAPHLSPQDLRGLLEDHSTRETPENDVPVSRDVAQFR
uniref:Uncharacterized protein LOC100179708 n=1 Tax=Phallusia mammillata TaxID=59560 RepID=A0A6F9DHT9_9ASCI|nr:uncharacterized protein LOC100179708 [Phallusia mammillata]